MFEVHGEEHVVKANVFANRMREVLINDEEIRVSKPIITTELRLSGLAHVVTTEEVISAIFEKVLQKKHKDWGYLCGPTRG